MSPATASRKPLHGAAGISRRSRKVTTVCQEPRCLRKPRRRGRDPATIARRSLSVTRIRRYQLLLQPCAFNCCLTLALACNAGLLSFDDGTIEAVYIYFSHRPVASTREIKRDVLLADFDAEGNIIGLEVLAPVKVSEIVMLADPNRRVSFERFVKGAAPAALIQA